MHRSLQTIAMVAAAFWLAAAMPAAALVEIVGVENASGVTFTVKGDLSLDDVTDEDGGVLESFIFNDETDAIFVTSETGFGDVYSIPITGGPFGAPSGTIFGVGDGDSFGFSTNGAIAVPLDYETGDGIHATLSFAGQTFADLGLSLGSFTYTLGNGDTVQVNIVPLPAAAPLFLAGLAGLGVVYRRRRRATA